MTGGTICSLKSNKSYCRFENVKSTKVSTCILDVEKTGNEPLIYTPLDEQTYSEWSCRENATVCREQVAFNEIVSPDVHSGSLRIVNKMQ